MNSRSILITISIVVALLLSGCVSSKQWLWATRPDRIVVFEDIKVERLTRDVTIPAGEYIFFGEHIDGFLYRCIGRKMLGEDGPFDGAILLYSKFDEVRIVQIVTKNSEEHSSMLNVAGEIGRYQMEKNLEKDGYIILLEGHPLSREIRRQLGLPERYPRPN